MSGRLTEAHSSGAGPWLQVPTSVEPLPTGMISTRAAWQEAPKMRISLESPDQPEILRLIDALDGYQKALYPPESHHGIDLSALLQPNVDFAVARTGDGVAVGCGAVVVGAQYAEIKRMFVSPAARGAGVGGRILTFIENCAKARGCTRLVLETGYLQTEALSLYARNGYVRCDPFGSYSVDPNSVFMQKSLA